MPVFHNICIIGLGLIGGSLARAIKERGLAGNITGIDNDKDNLKAALEEGTINSPGQIPGGVATADLVIIATPVRAALSIITQIAPHIAPGTIVTDVTSTKEQIVAHATGILPPGVSFVGGHPMAGSEKSGFRNSRPDLFNGAYYFITPVSDTESSAVLKIKSLVNAIDAVPVELTPGEHDRVVAIISHVPHLTAVALVNNLHRQPGFNDILPLAAGGFKDITRIASSFPGLWQEILMSNRTKIIPVLDNLIKILDNYKRALESGASETILEELSRARSLRQQISSCEKDDF
jgi:prephenate dehydrogenase